jgi:hypothetical protein
MRIGLYQQLLNESMPDPSWCDPANEAPQVHRQVLLFDPSGDGRIAELWGHLDPGTDNVAVYAPGTSNELSSFGAASDTALNIVTGDPSRRTAAVAWLGCDLPSRDPRGAACRVARFSMWFDITRLSRSAS